MHFVKRRKWWIKKGEAGQNNGMSSIFWKIIAKISWAFISLRYRVKVKGLEQLDSLDPSKGLLFLPNHPAHMDPLFLGILLWPKFRIRPVVIEYIFRTPFLKPLIRLVRAVSIPNFDTSINQIKIKKAKDAVLEVAHALKGGEAFLLYAAGQLKSTGKENLGGSSAAFALVNECPSAQVVLVRTTGLWGSSFSRAFSPGSPELGKTLWHGLKVLLKNGIFFAPRRDVEIEFSLDFKKLGKSDSRIAFNRNLERWYNRYPDGKGKIVESEPLHLVSYAFWKYTVPEIYQPKRKQDHTGDVAISSEMRGKIYGEIRRLLDNPGIEISPTMHLAMDLGMDSLNIAELIAYLTKNYDVEELHPDDLETVAHVLEVAAGEKESAHHPTIASGRFTFPEEMNRQTPLMPEGTTIPEVFFRCADRMGSFSACGDDVVGVLSYQKIKRLVLVLSRHFEKMTDEKIGVLLPSSVASYLLILALQTAGKVPVMLNWTLGPKYLEEMMRLSGATKVISSWRFLEKASYIDCGNLVDQMVLFEDIRQALSLKEKLTGAFFSFFKTNWLMKWCLFGKSDPKAPAVILFTSGTEAAPKGVPLSHENILENLRSALPCIDLNEKDVLYGILPPFHSFGFSVAGLFSFLAGVKIALYPDPTDGFALAEGIHRWKVTIFCAAPSFLKGLFSAAKDQQLSSVRFFVSGAEKASKELFERVKKLQTGAILMEGYGITECSPILTISRAHLPPKGVGQLVPGVEACTIHPETKHLLPEGSEGELCIRGKNVFYGYLGNPRSPFIQLNGQSWYQTGDIGKIDSDGTLILSGRLKRFVKIGGEMISLAAIESALNTALAESGRISADVSSLAVCGDEKVEGKPQLILFSTIPIDKEEANDLLKEQGLSRLIKISSVRRIEEIPLMGTGKTDYRALQSQI
jgi:long-chain-fatty-acid--[acyl-carrier-protein] ligase